MIKIEELMLTSDKLSALDNMSMRVVNGDFKSCDKKGRKREMFDKWNKYMQHIDFFPSNFHDKD